MSMLCITLGKSRIFCLPEMFCGPKICQNAFSAEAPSRTPLGQLTTVPMDPCSKRTTLSAAECYQWYDSV